MKVTYCGPRGRITRIGHLDVDVRPGVPVDLPAEIAGELLESYPDEWTAGGDGPAQRAVPLDVLLAEVGAMGKRALLKVVRDYELDVDVELATKDLRVAVAAALAPNPTTEPSTPGTGEEEPQP